MPQIPFFSVIQKNNLCNIFVSPKNGVFGSREFDVEAILTVPTVQCDHPKHFHLPTEKYG